MAFAPSDYGTLQAAYAGDESYVETAQQYVPLLKTLLFDEDPRIAYEKKSRELETAIAQYKASAAGFVKNALATRIKTLQAEVKGLAAQAAAITESEGLTKIGKQSGVAILVVGIGIASLVGYLLFEKAATERARRRQILSSTLG